MLDALLDLVLPSACAGCGGPSPWCRPCSAQLRAVTDRPLGLSRPAPLLPGFPRAAAAAEYDGAVRGALIAHKERGRLALAGPLGRALAAAVVCLDPPPGVALVPVPSSRSAVRARGHDHALRLARAAAQVLPGTTAVPLLSPARRLRDSAGLDASARAANLDGGYRAGSCDRAVVIVDDLRTTGASLAEAARALTEAGVRVHGAATVAATARTWSQRRP